MILRNTSRSLAQALAVFCMMGAAAAHAQDTDESDPVERVYLQIDMGVSPKTHTEFEGAPTGGMHHDGTIFPAALTIGFKPAGWQNEMGGLAIELSAFNRDLTIDRLTIGSSSQASDGRLRIGGLMANLRFEMNAGSGIHPYLTGGAGVACAEITDMPALKLRDKKAIDAKFAAHFGAGIGFQPEAFGRASLWLGYDILTMQPPRFETDFGIAPSGTIRVKHVLPQTVTLGARFAF